MWMDTEFEIEMELEKQQLQEELNEMIAQDGLPNWQWINDDN